MAGITEGSVGSAGGWSKAATVSIGILKSENESELPGGGLGARLSCDRLLGAGRACARSYLANDVWRAISVLDDGAKLEYESDDAGGLRIFSCVLASMVVCVCWEAMGGSPSASSKTFDTKVDLLVLVESPS